MDKMGQGVADTGEEKTGTLDSEKWTQERLTCGVGESESTSWASLWAIGLHRKVQKSRALVTGWV